MFVLQVREPIQYVDGKGFELVQVVRTLHLVPHTLDFKSQPPHLLPQPLPLVPEEQLLFLFLFISGGLRCIQVHAFLHDAFRWQQLLRTSTRGHQQRRLLL